MSDSSPRWAARQGDALSHTSAWADIISGSISFTGQFFAIAAPVVLLGNPFGMIGCAVLGAVVGTTLEVTGVLDKLDGFAESVGNTIAPPSIQAHIRTGSPDTYINSKPAARAAGKVDSQQSLSPSGKAAAEPAPEASIVDRAGELLNSVGEAISEWWNPIVAHPDLRATPVERDKIDCKKHPPMSDEYLAEGSSKVFINDQPAARSGDRSTCEGVIVDDPAEGRHVSPDVRVGGPPIVVRPIRSGKLPVMQILTALTVVVGIRQLMSSKLPCLLVSAGAGAGASTVTSAVLGSPHPVHAALGAKVLGGDGLLGRGWSLPFETSLHHTKNTLGLDEYQYYDEQGRLIELGTLAPYGAYYSEGEGLRVRMAEPGHCVIEASDGLYRLFTPSTQNPEHLLLRRLADRNDNSLFLHYDEFERLVKISDDWAPVIQLEYGEEANKRRVIAVQRFIQSPSGQEQGQGQGQALPATAPEYETVEMVRYHYHASGTLARVELASAQVNPLTQEPGGVTVRAFDYDAADRLIRHRLPSGRECQYEWREWRGSAGTEMRVSRYWSNAGDAYEFDYDLDQGITTVRDSLGRCKTHEWNTQYEVTRFTDYEGRITELDWNRERQLLRITQAFDILYRFSYDEYGNLCEETDAMGNTQLTR